jgi:hypothetical protein
MSGLNDIRVASPCRAEWDEMSGDDRVRHCADCNKNVYWLSGMTREEASDFLRAQEGETCVRYYRRADGTILTADCPVGLAAFRTKMLGFGALICSLTLGLFGLGFVAATRLLPRKRIEPLPAVFAPPERERGMVMGEICIPDEVGR